MDPVKIEVIVNWEAFKTMKGVQRFLEFVNFYRKFIKKLFPINDVFNEFGQKQR